MTKEDLIQNIKDSIPVFKKRHHLVKIRIFESALSLLEKCNEADAYEVLCLHRDREIGNTINHATSEVSDGYSDLFKLFKALFKEQKRAAKEAAKKETTTS